MSIQTTRIQLRRGTASALATVNEVPLAGEICIETDTGNYKVGDGSTIWSNLPYAGLRVPDGNSVYVLKNGVYEAANVVDMTETWSPSINGQDIVLAVDEDMTPYQLTGTNTEISALLNASCTSISRTSTSLMTGWMTM